MPKPALALLAGTLLASIPSVQQPKRIELVAPAGATIATFHVTSQADVLESPDGQSVIFSSTALAHLNHKDRTYYEQTYEDLAAIAAKAVKELPPARENSTGAEYTLTNDTEVIAGCKARRLVRTTRGVNDSVWVCKDWQPAAMRKAGERLLSVFPADYWRRVGGNPGLIETTLIYGIPLRADWSGKRAYDPRVTDGGSPASIFEIPAGYKRVPAPK